MKKLLAIILAILTIMTYGCAAMEEQLEEKTEGYTFTDDLGREVTVEHPERVACLISSFADIWCLAGGADQIVAATNATWIYFDLPLREDVVNLGATKELNMEQLIACEPDLVLASCGTDRNVELEDSFEQMGINVAYFEVSDFQDYLNLLHLSTTITGRENLYETHGVQVESQIQTVLEKSRNRGTAPKVLCMRASASMVTVKNSQDNVLGEMLCSLGCVNIADSDASLLENISLERILEADPEYIFIAQRGDDREGMIAHVEAMMRENPAWLQLTAVKEGKVFYMDKNLYNLKPNHRWGEAYEKLEEILEHG